jgi:hypothetical protein
MTLNRIATTEMIQLQIKTFNNTKVRAGEQITDTHAHVVGLFNYIHDKYQGEIDKLKTDRRSFVIFL